MRQWTGSLIYFPSAFISCSVDLIIFLPWGYFFSPLQALLYCTCRVGRLMCRKMSQWRTMLSLLWYKLSSNHSFHVAIKIFVLGQLFFLLCLCSVEETVAWKSGEPNSFKPTWISHSKWQPQITKRLFLMLDPLLSLLHLTLSQ